MPHRWITWQQACLYYAKEPWPGSWAARPSPLRRHARALTGERSSITANSIIAIKGKALAVKGFNQVPPLNNRELFHRDRFMCAFCGGEFSFFRLTCDHILPMSRGGRDTWMNVVTACRELQPKKGNRTPEEARMQLLYAPYVPEPRRVPDPHQPPHPRRPDGVPEAARRVAFAPGPELLPDFWRNSGFHLLERDTAGRLRVTDDFLRAYYLRPEMHPVEESGDAELRAARGADGGAAPGGVRGGTRSPSRTRTRATTTA